MKLECNILLKDLGWCTIIPHDKEIDGSLALEIGLRLLEMDSNVKRIEFKRYGDKEK